MKLLYVFLIQSNLCAYSFNNIWTNNWYPVAVMEDTNPNKVHSTTILNKNFVYWKNSDKWTFGEDSCPHRAVPLSHGYLDHNKNLVCRYHDWTFNSNGHCIKNPMANNKCISCAKFCEKSRIKVYPIKESYGILWCWLGGESIDKNISLSEEFDHFSNFICKEYPVDYQFLMENTFDPSHATFLHSGFFGFNRKNAVPFQKFIRRNNITENGFLLEHSDYSKNINTTTTRDFRAPLANIVSNERFNTVLYFVPIKPGYTRVIGGFSQTFDLPLPKWLKRSIYHLASYKIEEQDITILNSLPIVKNWKRLYYLPTKADVGVTNFRRWFETYSNNSIPWLSDDFVKSTDFEKYNRWISHTSKCLSCQKTIKFIDNIKYLSFFLMICYNVIYFHKNIRILLLYNFFSSIFIYKLHQFRNMFYIGKNPFIS